MKAAYAAQQPRARRGRAQPARARRAPRASSRYVTQSVAFFSRPTGPAGPARRGHAAVDRCARPDRRGRAGRRAGRARGARGRRRRAALRLLRRARDVVLRRTARSASSSASGATRSSARARACTRSSTSTTPRPPPSPPSTRRPASTTSSTTTPPRRTSGCPAFAAALGAPPPRRVPALPVKVLGAGALFAWQEGLEGVSNARAKAALGLDTRPRVLADRVPRPVRFRHGARRATEAGQRMPAVLDVLRPRDQALHLHRRRTAPRSTTTTTRSPGAATWAACTRCSRPRSTSSCSSEAEKSRSGFGVVKLAGAAARALRLLDRARLPRPRRLRQPALLRLARGRAGRRAGLRPARPALTSAARPRP